MSIEFISRGTGFKDFQAMLQNKSQTSQQLAGKKIKVVSSAEYSGYVDQGTRYMTAQPFFQSTLDAHNPSEIGQDITSEKVRQYAQKIANEMKNKAPVDTGYLRSSIKVQG